MTNPEEEFAKSNEDNDNPRNSSNEQENAQTIESDMSGNGNDVTEGGEVEADTDAIDVAARASEAAYTLDVDKGIAPKQ